MPRVSSNFLKELVVPLDANIDIVAVHGLNPTNKDSHAESAWTSASGKLWLKEFLPLKLPKARVLLFSYNANVALNSSTAGVREQADNLLNRLSLISKDPTRPIIFICHSLGGIIVKQALVTADLNENYRCIRAATYGIAFFGTPHQGGRGAGLGDVVARVFRAFNQNPENSFFEALKKDSSAIETLTDSFRHQLEHYKILSFFETRPQGILGVIVDKTSATLNLPGTREIQIGLDTDHANMCKFESAEDYTYEQVVGNLVNVARDALLALKTKSPRPFQSGHDSSRQRVAIIPFSQNRAFVGREYVLDKIDAVFSNTEVERRAAIYGLGGVGKSQVALQYAHRQVIQAPERYIFWVSAASRSNFEKTYREIAEKMQYIGLDDPKTNILRLVKRNLESVDCGDWLMIIDNADDMDLFFGAEQVQLGAGQADVEAIEPLFNYIPEESQGLILYTTRSKSDAHALLAGDGKLIGLDNMGVEEAKELFKKKLGAASESKIESNELLGQLLEELEYLPLAIVQAASYICEIELCTVSHYLAEYCRGNEEKWKFMSHEARLRAREQSVSQSILKTWIITFTMLKQKHNKAAEYLCMMAFLNRQDIPLYLLKEASETSSSFFQAINPLIAYSFISANETKDSFSFHRLVQISTQHWVESEGESAKWANESLCALSQHFPDDEEISKRGNELFPHVKSALENIQSALENNQSAEVNMEARGRLLNSVSLYLEAKGDYKSSVSYGEMAVADTRAAFGDMHERTLTSIDTLARALRSSGYDSEAERYAHEAAKGRECVLGENHRHTLASQAILAAVLGSQGKWDEAFKIMESVHRKSQELFGEEDGDVLDYVYGLGSLHRTMGQLALAEKCLRRVVEGRHKLLGPHHRSTLDSMLELSTTLVNQEKLPEAKSMIQMVLKGYCQLLGENHPQTLYVLSKLAWILGSEKKHEESCQLYRKVLSLQETSIGEHHPDTVATMNNLALVLTDLGNMDEAEALDRQALNINTMKRGADHPDTLMSMYNLARLLYLEKRYLEAEELLQRELKLREGRYGEEHPELLQTLHCLVRIHKMRNEKDEMAHLSQRIVEISKVAARDGVELTINQRIAIESALWILADIHYKQERYPEAEELLQQQLKSKEDTYGKEHPRLLYTLAYLALAIEKTRGEQDEIKQLSQRIAEIGRKAAQEGLDMAEDQKNIVEYALKELPKQGEPIELISNEQGASIRESLELTADQKDTVEDASNELPKQGEPIQMTSKRQGAWARFRRKLKQ